MNAAKNRGVVTDRELVVAKKAIDVGSLILSGKRSPVDESALEALDVALQAFWDRQPFTATGEVLKPATFAEFLAVPNRTPGMFNQLASEVSWWTLLDQIEQSCFLQPERLEIARSVLITLWKDEIARKPYQPPKDWRYLPVMQVAEWFKKIFGSSLVADAVVKHASKGNWSDGSEGFLTAPKLTTLARLFAIEGNPLEDTTEGRIAYARIVELFVPKVGEEYVKAHRDKISFANWREGALTADHIVLTPAGRKAWQELEAQYAGDFVIAPAISGRSYAGYSQRLARLWVALSGNQMPQDCIMTGSTLMVQPQRLCDGSHLRIDNPGNAYSPDADGEFWDCVSWVFLSDDRGLVFGSGNAGDASRGFGSAVVLRS
ncbi:MAG: hypothetical protein A3C85_01850 [Candidatus Doudnabacteria bacterium RIFCSPHIGHO2_02_FULL_48_21]|uniref:Uncharacterized protein n=1 Tax=Candidatus Doudnabacteria bacterium RIFCSPLOWO2_02_FULL_48_13 TaxID=1817845 RepID=A0A1F5QA20_9BACT|nr:MAG: hypothetical protein A3K05_02055 [Candidatus Doudnabacteria bacterium RIFCSPHIGHO2_01_48_18]OGE78043.1 MAG: hypothetical protein A2668_03670 [Candidatus Doudnabacteria bacterium RIFCSPHIGHO2_01_FULL_48_180]OGE91358.1 MAG: hypothetical protein A3F44_03605 [Candidatus Doudnabacteria bacterium RIFCSPHIGHO2_12_FULL_47_25]OGE93170.1 MAG: hypothetical protein A3C85_01850 [Candidatus Doudnabacteria bacterium RIFCSPHIGHO2_02_FULL_48_21]OGE96691.1 MAG: hypothetical protein A3A83_02725 [Candidatu